MISCEYNPTKIEESQQYDEYSNEDFKAKMREEAEARMPTCAYCKYNQNHMFKTVLERETHEDVCPDKATYESRWAQTSRIYNANKDRIEQMRMNKKAKIAS